MYLFFDTETTGLPISYTAPATDLNNWPRIIQFAWALYDQDTLPIASSSTLILPDGWTVPTGKFWVDNGFSQQQSEEQGVPMEDVFDRFYRDIAKADYLIAHNMGFDFPITKAEMLRILTQEQTTPIDTIPKRICTMRATTDLLAIPGYYGNKYPKLEELHKYLFQTGFKGAHDAMNDVQACARCFFELQSRGLIK